MDNLFNSNQQYMPAKNDIISIIDATIVKVSSVGGTGYVTIDYVTVDQNFMVRKNVVTLVVGPSTVIKDPFDENFPFGNLRPGLIVDADFSSAMTFSIPPQARAFRIVVSFKNWPFNSKISRVLEVDSNNRLLYTGNADEIYSQVRYAIPNSTVILDRSGNRIRLEDLKRGQLVAIAHATFMTASIPPQTTAFRIQVL